MTAYLGNSRQGAGISSEIETERILHGYMDKIASSGGWHLV